MEHVDTMCNIDESLQTRCSIMFDVSWPREAIDAPSMLL